MFNPREIEPEVDLSKLDEVLIITAPMRMPTLRRNCFRPFMETEKSHEVPVVPPAGAGGGSFAKRHCCITPAYSGVRPDLGLMAACLVGFLGGELDGLILGPSFWDVFKICCPREICGSMW